MRSATILAGVLLCAACGGAERAGEASSLEAVPEPAESITVGVHRIELIVPDGWRRLDQGRQQRFEREGPLQIFLLDMGPLVLHALRQELGDNAFFSSFKTLLSNRRYQHLTIKDAISVVNFVTKQDYTGFADRYILGTEMPDVKTLKGKKKRK
jgi:hypothetical protein